MAEQIAVLKVRRGTTTEWASANPILSAGELGYDTTLNRMKIGDGINPWASRGWSTMDPSEVESVLSAAATISDGVDATDGALAAALETPGSASGTVLSAKMGALIAADVPPAVADALADDDTVAQAAAAAVDARVDELDLPTVSGTSGDLILTSEDGVDTWMQARGEVDPVTGLALPTVTTVTALHQVGMPSASGTGSTLIVVGEGGREAAVPVSSGTGEDLILVGENGIEVRVLTIHPGPPPAALDLPAGAARIFLNDDGEPVMLAIGR